MLIKELTGVLNEYNNEYLKERIIDFCLSLLPLVNHLSTLISEMDS